MNCKSNKPAFKNQITLNLLSLAFFLSCILFQRLRGNPTECLTFDVNFYPAFFFFYLFLNLLSSVQDHGGVGTDS